MVFFVTHGMESDNVLLIREGIVPHFSNDPVRSSIKMASRLDDNRRHGHKQVLLVTFVLFGVFITRSHASVTCSIGGVVLPCPGFCRSPALSLVRDAGGAAGGG